MNIMLASILLNEEEWLIKHYDQHKDWPGLVKWVFVEGADTAYGNTCSHLVNSLGLSVDRTTEILEDMKKDPRVEVISHGWMSHSQKDQAKCQGRNRYLEVANKIKPDIVITTDIDEFYTYDSQKRINEILVDTKGEYTAWMFSQRHIWRPDAIKSNYLFDCEVVGKNSYFGVPHTRVWKYLLGIMHNKNHNWPDLNGKYLTESMMRCDLMDGMPECIHLGYASSQENRRAKADYYKARGEGSEGGRIGRKRSMYVSCRDAHLGWKPGDTLPHGAQVIPYEGPVPEVFR